MLSFSPITDTVSGAYDVVTHLATVLAPIGGTAVAIVAFTLLVRLLLHPLTRAAVRGERAKQRLAPKIAELREKHRGNPTRFAEELTELHRGAGISPFAGMLPLLAQTPFFLVMYQIFVRTTIGQHANALMSKTLFGVPLGAHIVTATITQLWVFGVLFGAIALVGWLTSRRSAMLTALSGATATGLLAWLPRVLPYLTVVTAAFVPLAAGLYLLTTTAWSVAENTFLRRGVPQIEPQG